MTAKRKASIAFIGTGLMGEPMAMRLISAGHPVTVWNRTPEKARGLVTAGARQTITAAEAVDGVDMLILMLSAGSSVTEILFDREVAGALRKAAIVVDMSSIPPPLAREHATRLAVSGIDHLDAPVSGGTKGARDGTLAIMAGGDETVFDTARPVLEVMGRPTRVGPSGAGQLAKLANQIIVGVTITAVAEALLLAAAGGADPAKVREALSGGFADSMILKQHGARMLERSWMPGGALSTQVKDLRTILSVASDLGLTLPVCAQTAELYESGLKAGLADYDHSAVLLELERRNAGHRVGDGPDQPPARSTPQAGV